MRTLREAWGPQIYPTDVLLITDPVEYAKLAKQSHFDISFPPWGCAWTSVLESERHGILILVVLGEHDDIPDSQTELALTHEAVHVWQFTKKAIREKKASMEQEAYAICHFADWLIEDYHYQVNRAAKKAAKAKAAEKAARLAKRTAVK